MLELLIFSQETNKTNRQKDKVEERDLMAVHHSIAAVLAAAYQCHHLHFFFFWLTNFSGSV